MKAKKQVKGWRKEVDTFFSRWHAFISKHIHPNAVPVMVFAVVIFSFLFMFMLKQAGIIGMVISPAGLNYSDEINMNFSRTQEYIWYPDNIGDINSISLDGNIIGNGSVRISMIIGDETYLVLDSTLLEAQSGGLITGFVTGIETGVETGNITLDELSEEEFADIESEIEQQETNVTEEESEPAAPPLPIPPENADIQINLEYLNDSNFDTDNEGIEVYDGVIDLSISDTAFNWAVDESHLCTKWIITNHDIIEETAFCYGDAQCCDLIEVDLLGEIWDDDYYSFKGKDGAGENNTISAQVIYVDYNLSSENLYSYIYYSNNAEKQLIFLPTSSQMISFNNGCIDTCILSSINETNYRFIIETGPGTTFELHKINYYFAGSAMNLTGLQPDDLINTSYTLLCNDGELGMKDTYLRLRYPDVNYGDYDSVKVGNENALDWYRRGLFQFNLSYIQSNAVITSAELKIYKKTGAPDPNITLYRMIQSWDEDEATWDEYAAGQPWNNSGGDYDPGAYASEIIDLRWATFNITDLVQEWVSGKYDNYGLILLRDPEDVPNTAADFKSSETKKESERPRLIINYTWINDTEAPSIGIISDIDNKTFAINQIIHIIITAYDEYGIDSAFANISFNNSSVLVELLPMAENSSVYSGVFTNTSQPGNYTINLIVTDNNGVVNGSIFLNFAIVESFGPEIEIISPIENYTYVDDSTATIKVNATDTLGVDSVLANITWPGESRLLELENIANTTLYSAQFSDTYYIGDYTIQFIANNTLGFVNDTVFRSFNVCDSCSLEEEITIIISNSSTAWNETINITINEDGSVDLDMPDDPLDVKYTVSIPFDPPVIKITFYGLSLNISYLDIGVDYPLTYDDSPFLNLEQIYVLDFSQFDFEYAIIYVSAKGQSLYKCPTWNFTTRTCVNEGANWGTPTPGVKTEKEGNGTSGWLEWMDIPDDESVYSFYMYPGDPGFIEDGANYCSESPCIATSDMICSVDNAGGIAEFNQPNTLDNCRDGQKGTYLTDESVENITITDLNGSVFMVGDTVNVKATVHCWHDGSEDNINIVYSNNTGGVPQSWRVIDYVDPCPAGGMNEISLNFTLDNRTGNHSIRVINQHNGAVTATCGNGNYDDNDDLSFEVFCHDENETEPPGILKMEWDTVTAGESWEIVNLSNTYVSPVIVVSNQYANNNLPFVPRISNVTNNSFIIKIQNPGQSPVAPETLHYLVVEEGNWTLPDGTPIEARKYLSTVVGSSSNWIGESQSHNNIYSNPIVVFASLMSYNDPGWQTVTPWGSGVDEPPSYTKMVISRNVAEDTDTIRADETVGFVVIGQAFSSINGIKYESRQGDDIVKGVDNEPPYIYSFKTPFNSTPEVALVAMGGLDSGDGGWSQLHGSLPFSTINMSVSIDEDQIGDIERFHTSEQVVYIVFEQAGCYGCGVDEAPPQFNESEMHPSENSSFNQSEVIPLLVSLDENATVIANITYPDSSFALINLTFNSTEWYFTGNLTDTSLPGDYHITYTATDINNNTNTINLIFTIIDNTAPSVTSILPFAGQNYTQDSIVQISANVTDAYYENLAPVSANVSWDSVHNLVNLSFNSTSGLWEGIFDNTSLGGIYNITIIASDHAGNTNSTETTWFNIIDLIPPQFNELEMSPPNNSSFNQSEPVNLVVSLDEDATVTANITYPDFTDDIFNMPFNGTEWYFNSTLTDTLMPGDYNITYTATDINNNTNTINLIFTIVDSTAPSVTDILPSAGQNYTQDSIVHISANVTDLYYNYIALVSANVSWNSVSEIIYLSFNSTSGLWEASFDNTSIGGIYDITIIAPDHAGNINDTETSWFNILDYTVPSIDNITTSPQLPFVNTGISQNISINFTSSEYPINVTFGLYNSSMSLVDISDPLYLSSSSDLPVIYTIPSGLGQGEYTINISLMDNSGNINTTNLGNFTVYTSVPQIELISPAENYTYVSGSNSTIKANITDNSGISTAIVNVTWNNSFEELGLQQIDNSTFYQAIFTNTSYIGNYTLQIIAKNNYNLVNDTFASIFNVCENCSDIFEINISFFNNSAFENVTVNASWGEDGSFIIIMPNEPIDVYYSAEFPFEPPVVKVVFYGLSDIFNIYIGVDYPAEYPGAPFLDLAQVYALDFSQVVHDYAVVFVESKGESMYKCANWNFTTRECMNPGENWGIPIPGVKTEKEGNGTTGWENLITGLPEAGQIYNFTLYPGDPGYIEDGANYCTYSPCIATSAMIRSVDNAGGIAEFDQPNTIDTCADGTSGTYLTDESVENITLTSLNHSQFITGDTINFKTTVHCYDDGSMDNITFVYSNSTETAPSSWKIINKITPCPGSGIQEVSTNFTIDNRTGNHSVRVIIRYNASADVTCGTGNYDDNDDLSFEVYEIIQTTPTSNSPSDLDVDIGEEAVIGWTLQDDEGAGDYYVTRNGQLFAGPEQWVNNTKLIIRPNNYFLGTWNYTIYYNNSQGNYGIQDTVFVNVTDKTFPSCENVAGSSNSNIPTMTNITIDGSMEDWEAVLLNSRNYLQDLTELSGDLDTGMTADRDLTGFAYTWDSQYLYFYYKRLESGANVINMLVYLDYDNDGFMNSTDNVMRFVWSGSNRKYNSDLYNYIPSGTADELTGSGYNMPGAITINTSLEDNIIGGEESGIELEVRVLWSDLGFTGPVPITIKAASSLGTNLPSQIEDNMGIKSTAYSLLLFEPDNTKPSTPGTSVYYDHDLRNCGMSDEIIDLLNISSQSWQTTLYYPDGTLISDTNSNNKSDVALAVDNFTTVIVKIDVPGTTPIGTIDQAAVTATSSIDSTVNKTVTDTTNIGDITIIPAMRIISGAPGIIATLNYTIYNQQSFSDTLEINVASILGWNVSLSYINGSAINDTDGDNHYDIGSLLPGESRDILLDIRIPSDAIHGSQDLTTIRINSSVNSTLTINASAETIVKNRITIEPDYARSVGIGDASYYALTISNNWNTSDVIYITPTSLLGWDTTFYDSDMTTLLTDTDSDGIVDIGSLGILGANHTIYARIVVPDTATNGDLEATTVFANSSNSASAYNTSEINTTARVLITYSDAAYSIEEVMFEVGDIVYAKAYSISAQRVYFQWVDSNNAVIRISHDIEVSSEDDANDFFATNTSSLLGNWTVIVFDAKKDSELGRIQFTLSDITPPVVTLDYPPENYANPNATPMNITFNCSAAENYNLQNISLYITDASNQSFGLNSTASISGISSSSTWMLELPIGDYSWNCLAHDTSGNSDWGNEDRTMRVGAVIISAPILHSPANGKSDPETKPAFVWYNSTMDKLGSIKYHLQVDDTYDFSSALDVNVAGIVEGDALSNYALTTGLELDTQYYWRVRAYDGIYYSGWSDTWQYYTEGTIALSFIQQNVSFGIMDLGAINDTSDNLPLPFIIRNDGDVFADITINASAALWVAQPLGTKYFQFKAADRNEPGSFNTSGSPTTWNNISLNIALAIKQLDYNNVHDTAVIDILMEVPTDEPAGAKTADINFHAKKST